MCKRLLTTITGSFLKEISVIVSIRSGKPMTFAPKPASRTRPGKIQGPSCCGYLNVVCWNVWLFVFISKRGMSGWDGHVLPEGGQTPEKLEPPQRQREGTQIIRGTSSCRTIPTSKMVYNSPSPCQRR
jgi:hypothetical protein